MANTKRVFIEGDTSTDVLPSSLEGAISYLQDLLDKVPSDYRETCVVDFEVLEGYGDHTSVFSVYYNRPETREESKIRRELEKKKEEAQRARDLFQLEQIQKRLGISK